MAILPAVPGLEVTVQVDDFNLREYDDPHESRRRQKVVHDPARRHFMGRPIHGPFGNDDKTPRVTKYIESQTGRYFSVCFLKEDYFHHFTHHIAFRIHIDGIKRAFVHEPTSMLGGEWGQRVEYATQRTEEGRITYRFRFSDLQIRIVASHRMNPAAIANPLAVPTDEFSMEEVEEHKIRAAELGTIKVSVYDMDEPIYAMPGRGPPARDLEYGIQQNELAEKALKGRALTHSMCLSDPVMVKDWSQFKEKRNLIKKSLWSDPRKRPFAVYEFRYRSMEGLIQEAIVSRIDNTTATAIRNYAVDLEPTYARDRRCAPQNNRRKRGASPEARDEPRKRPRPERVTEVIDLTADEEDDDMMIY